MKTRQGFFPLFSGIALAASVFSSQGVPVAAGEKKEPLIQLAILLDTSGSMSGLIEQAKRELWRIVNELGSAKKGEERPHLEVALYEYGNDGLPQENGYLRQIVPLTDDLDKVSEELFVLTTNGGSEYCGKVIQVATNELAWSSSNKDLKTIFISGNEPFTQGDVDYRQACQEAIAKGITVNTIFCGPEATGISTNWKDGAVLADGSYLSIDQNHTIAHIEAPQDKEIARLGIELNKTYVPYGALGRANSMRQSEQDSNAIHAGNGASVQRAACKASPLYCNASWDLVDAIEQSKVELENVKTQDLPEEMHSMSLAEKRSYLEVKAKERRRIQEEIKKQDEARKRYVAEERKKPSKSGDETLDSAIIKCIRTQATAKNFTFEDC